MGAYQSDAFDSLQTSGSRRFESLQSSDLPAFQKPYPWPHSRRKGLHQLRVPSRTCPRELLVLSPSVT